jgi:hypothetical protein
MEGVERGMACPPGSGLGLAGPAVRCAGGAEKRAEDPVCERPEALAPNAG